MLTALTKEELKIKCKEKEKRELVILNEVNDLDKCLKMIDDVVAKTKLPQENEYLNEINEWKRKYELLEAKYNEKLERINELKENLNDLRITIKKLK